MKNKTTAGVLALLFGGLGVHKFYLGKIGYGILYLLFCWTFIPSLVSLIEGIMILTSTDEAFNQKYNTVFYNQQKTFEYEKLVNVQKAEAKQRRNEEQEKRKAEEQKRIEELQKEKLKELEQLEAKALRLREEAKIILKSDLDNGIISKELYEERLKQLELGKEPKPQNKVEITSKEHRDYSRNLKAFELLKPDLINGNQVCLSEYEEKKIRAFSEKFLPEAKFNIVRPLYLNTYIAGLRYHDYAKNKVKELLEEAPFAILDLELEPNNQHDRFAIKVYLEEYLLGYIPREINETVFNVIQNGKKVYCSITEIDEKIKIEERIKIEIEIRTV